ncbi:L-lactate permease [Actinopolyspora mortivallis]|uniref:L-lactate permease n=1 Tax=Actinopolyspora mortivallis TaxID=33906 RepID=A0A2T0H063_ACTMO|nr:L-lactate permease [Actinopolyspora mortivallis]PRW64756.1 L-lactate permease [Actinopolyspora mortivallis]
MLTALAAVPPAVALGLLLARVRPVLAAVLALTSAAVVAAAAFPTPAREWVPALREVLPTGAEVALILFGGVLLNELTGLAGVNERLAEWLISACRHPSRAVVLVLLGVTPFAESVMGFGVGVVVAVPLLRRVGLSPARASVVGLLGLVTVPWGALGPGTLVASRFTGVPLRELGVLSALLSPPVFLLAGGCGLVLAVGASRARRAVPELLTGVAVLGVSVWAVNATLGVPLAGVLGGLATVGALLVVARVRDSRRLSVTPELVWALRPYACLVAGLLGVHALVLVPGVAGTAWYALVSSPAVWLLVTCALCPPLLDLSRGEMRMAVRGGMTRWVPVGVTTVVFLLLGALLTATGMSAALAEAATGLGGGYLVLAPFVGALGGILTGSNAGANAMFATSQAAAAHSLGLQPAALVAVQNVSASLATMASAPRVALAVGLARDTGPPTRTPVRHRAPSRPGDEGDGTAVSAQTSRNSCPVDQGSVLRTVLLVDLVVLAFLGLLTVLLPW